MKMKKLGLLLMLLCASFAMHAQELKKGDKLPDFYVAEQRFLLYNMITR